MEDVQIARPTEPPNERVAIISPDVVAMRSRGVQSCATVTSVQRHVPSPIPRKTGYPQTWLLVLGLDVAMRMKKIIMLTKAKTDGSLTSFVVEQNAPARREK